MKKRIISLILVVAMAVCALVGCGYSYESDDLTKYATFDKEAFVGALLSVSKPLEIADGDFGTDEDVRNNKVQDKIFTSLGSSVDAEDKIYEGEISKYDILYYSYYVTATVKDTNKNDVERIFFAKTKLAEKSATKLQLGFSEYSSELDEKISEIMLGKNIKDYIYKTDTTRAIGAGDKFYVSYTKSVPQFNTDGSLKADEEGKTLYADETHAYELMTAEALPENIEAARSFVQQLIDKKPGKVTDSIKASEDFNGKSYEVTYSDVNIHWVVDSMNTEITVTDTTYTSTKKETAEDGKSYDLKDVELTYHILPVYYLDVDSEITPYSIIKELLGSLKVGKDANDDGKIEKDEYGTFSFLHEDLKNGDEAIADIVTKLNELLTEYEEKIKAVTAAKKTLDSAQKTVDEKGENATDAQKTALEDAKKAYDEAVKKQDEAEAEADKQIEKLLGCGEGLDTKVIDEYTQSVYDALEDAYEAELAKNLSYKVWELAEKSITYKENEDGTPVLPWDSVHDFYNRSVEKYKYDFYTGTYSTTNKISNYEQYNGDFNAYLKVKVGLTSSATMQQVYDIIGAEAEENARQLILTYSMYKAFGEDVALTEEDKNSAKNMLAIYEMIYGEGYATLDDFIHAAVLDNVMDYILEVEERAEDETDLTVVFKRVKYVIESDDDESDKDAE